jgi:hypothetical protein
MSESDPHTGDAGTATNGSSGQGPRSAPVELPRPDGRYPLPGYVEAYFLGDITAIAAAGYVQIVW